MPDYRNPLRAFAVLALVTCTCIPNLALGEQNNEGLTVIPFKITNNLVTTEPLFVYLFGVLSSHSVSYPTNPVLSRLTIPRRSMSGFRVRSKRFAAAP